MALLLRHRPFDAVSRGRDHQISKDLREVAAVMRSPAHD
jgi:hypothetical protein